jgi:glutaredoxin
MKRRHRQGLTLVALWLAASAAVWAQTIYRSVDAAGRVSYSDQAPTAVAPVQSATAKGSTTSAALPFALRQVATRFPVTLYTGPNCPPCQSARALLTARGVPFAEKTVSTQQDIDALQRMAGESVLPLLTVGAQHIQGFLESEWRQYLDAAGYPASSQLPADFRPAAATALMPPAPPPPSESRRIESEPPRPPIGRGPGNPTGLQF